MKLSEFPSLAAICASLAGLLAVSCSRVPPAPPASPPLVTVARPVRLAFRDYLEATGTTAASRSVNLTARVEGTLEKIYFRDGSEVAAGAPLFLIEPAPYEAKLALNQAQLKSARAEYARQQRLMAANATSESSVESWRAQRDAAEANTELARIELGYTRVTAPFAGRIGRHLVDVGNLVGNGQATVLATLDQLKPIYVYFTVNELDLLRLRAAMRKYHLSKLPQVVPVEAALQTDRGYPYHGTLNFIDIALNAGTGALEARAVFPNAREAWVPGLFVKLRIAVSPPHDRLAVPSEAVGRDQAGAYLLVVDDHGLVRQIRVQVGGLKDGMRAITSGLDARDRVVVNGLLNAAPGSRVTAIETRLPQSAVNPAQASR